MDENTVISYTQEQLDAAVAANTQEVENRFRDYVSPDVLSAKNAELEAARLDVLRLRTAAQSGLPTELADRLTGTNEEELKQDAQRLSQYLSRPHDTPKYSGEEPSEDPRLAILRALKG